MPVAVACLALSACVGASSGSHHPSRSVIQTVASTAHVRVVRAPDLIHATMPAGWYGQTYAMTNIVITSFPIHTIDQAVQPLPRGAASLNVFDSPPRSRAVCRAHAHPHGRLQLGGFERSYEQFGRAYRIAFWDRGHRLLVFVSFGSHASHVIRRDAIAVVNSIHADRHACPTPSELRA